MKYTTVDNITRKLRGRLKVAEDPANTIYPITNPNQLVDLDLINTIAEEKEYFLDLILDHIYVLPIKNEHFILREIIDSLIISDIIGIHFQGSAGFGYLSSDSSGQAVATRERANTLISMLVAGTNLTIPGTIPTQYIPGGMPPLKLILPGEILKDISNRSVVVFNDCIIDRFEEKTSVNVDSRYLVEARQKNNPFSMDFQEKGWRE